MQCYKRVANVSREIFQGGGWRTGRELRKESQRVWNVVESPETHCWSILTFCLLLNYLEKSPAALCRGLIPELFKDLDCVQSLEYCFLKLVLSIINPSLQLDPQAYPLCIVGCVQLGLFDVSECIVNLVFLEVQKRQEVMSQKRLIVPFEAGPVIKDRLEMVNGLLSFTLVTTYIAKSEMRFTDQIFSGRS